jgi:hypothetical protein
MDRAHRIGQKKEVQVFRFCIENSIEEKVGAAPAAPLLLPLVRNRRLLAAPGRAARPAGLFTHPTPPHPRPFAHR